MKEEKQQILLEQQELKAKQEILNDKDFHIGAMGSGSDYSSFIQHLGLPSLSIGFDGENAGGEYHSIYDSYDHYSKFKDPGFVYGVALAKTAGRAALRMADAEVLPFDFTRLQKTIAGYIKELSGSVDQLRETTKVENELIKSNVYQLAQDPTKPEKLPVVKSTVPYLDFHGIQNALDELDRASKSLNEWLSKQDNKVSAKTNQSLYRAEQQLLSAQGLPKKRLV
jgi:N-acetylated-alpha-linked acidic dipeptidase